MVPKHLQTGQKTTAFFGLSVDSLIIISSLTLLGAAIRFVYIYDIDFPLNDGGFFYVMINDLIRNNFIIPKFTSYNFANIPYAYPPLPFYITAIGSKLFNIPVIDFLRILPVIINILAIPTFYFLARELLETPFQAVIATTTFAIIPPTYEWLIMGGGITRSPAYTLSLLTLLLDARQLKYEHGMKYTLLISFCLASTVMSHLEIAWVTVIAIFILHFSYLNRRKAITTIVFIGSLTVLISLPYLFTVVLYHGFSPFISAFASGGFNLLEIPGSLLFYNFTGELYLTPIAVIVFIGIAYCVFNRSYVLPLWFLLVFILDFRSAPRSAAVPVSLLVALGLDRVILPALNKNTWVSSKPNFQYFRLGFLGILFAQTALNGMLYNANAGSLKPLSLEDRQAMGWVETSTAKKSNFLMLVPDDNWATNSVAEWFPALTERTLINPVQGYEWLASGRFSEAVSSYSAILSCYQMDIVCFDKWYEQESNSMTYIYLSHSEIRDNLYTYPLKEIERQFRSSPQYEVVFENKNVVIFSRR